ncbi:glycosyltransferase family 25 protein [Salinivibrio sp. SS2]|uniref:glycosyltransferase family 25 protein n=1 Tax=Salinivibrio sp. SS2 TaxID=1892894 RepID=UPI0020C7B73A|nr:glycosyltransferase family 25 protein [Salinivibrio sp. DV]
MCLNKEPDQAIQVFVISLQESTERRERIKKQLDQRGIAFQFFDAINSHYHVCVLEQFENAQKTKRIKGYRLKTPELACFASHRQLWKKCVDNKKPIVILEDNVDLNDFSILDFIKICEQVRNYPYIKLAATRKKKFLKIKKVCANYHLGQYIGNTCGTTAYIVGPIAAQAFLDGSKQFIEPVDDYMEKSWKHSVKTYSISPSLFERAKITSTISSASSRKLKENIGLMSWIYIESYRVFEFFLRLFHFLDWSKIIKNKIV